jgi:hypothetical protein
VPGIATHFTVLKLTIERLDAAGDPGGVAQVMKDHLPYAHLGAVGPVLGDFLPANPFPLDQPFPEDYPTLWRRIFHIVGRKDLPGLYHILKQLRAMLDTIQPLADAEDCEGLKALADAGFEAQITEVTQQFATAIAALQAEALVIAQIIGDGLRPRVSTATPADPVPPPDQWSMREVLHWRKTGAFVNALLAKADEHADDRLRAYAYGYLVAYSASAGGNAHVNSIAGGPARTQWWRQRWVKNYVDAWVHGFYNQTPRPTMSGDTPSPAYDSGTWPNLCSANLHLDLGLEAHDPEELMDLAARVQPLPEVVPSDFAQRWFAALDEAQDTPLPAGVDAGALNSAYLFTWLTLWFQTSGSLLGCDATPPLEPPDGCGESPTELDPFKDGVPIDGVPPEPPPAEIDYDVDELAIFCAILLAILGGIAILGGNVALGGAAIGGAVALLDCDSVVDLDWKKLRCLLFWERMFLHNALKGVHRLLALAALDYPYARELALDQDFQDLFPFLEPWESGKHLTKSKMKERYPGKCWDGTLLAFNRPPTDFEAPQTIAYRAAVYPDFFVDDDVNNPIVNSEVRKDTPQVTAADGGRYKREAGVAGSQVPDQFGNAVANAVDLLTHLGEELPQWNLDADRGLAYLTWTFRDAKYDPDDVRVDPEA